MTLPLVKLLTRPGCVTCDQAKFVIKKLRVRCNFEAKVVNILKEKQYMEHNDFLPVILVNEKVVCRTTVSERDLKEAIDRATHN